MTNKEDWFQFIEQEEGELLAMSIVEQVVRKSEHVLFEKHIDVQVLPFVVQFAKATLLNIINV